MQLFFNDRYFFDNRMKYCDTQNYNKNYFPTKNNLGSDDLVERNLGKSVWGGTSNFLFSSNTEQSEGYF